MVSSQPAHHPSARHQMTKTFSTTTVLQPHVLSSALTMSSQHIPTGLASIWLLPVQISGKLLYGNVQDCTDTGPRTNLGPFFYTLSGTAGYTYTSVGRGIPAIAFSGGNGDQRSYQWINATTPSGYPDPATIQAQLAVNLVNTLVNNTAPGERLLPQGYGVTANTPYITSLTNDSCVNPPFVQTRLTGDADYDQAVFNSTTGLFRYANIVPPNGVGGNTCINGDCSLPGETTILASGCQSSVSVFTVDYNAPVGAAQNDIRSRLSSLVKYQNGTGSASGNGSGSGSGSVNATHGYNWPGSYGPPVNKTTATATSSQPPLVSRRVQRSCLSWVTASNSVVIRTSCT